MRVALPPRHRPGVEERGRLIGEHRHAHIQQGHVDMLPFPGPLGSTQRGQDGGAGVDTGEQVGDGNAHAQRPCPGGTIRATGDAHQAAHGLDQQVVASAAGVRPVLTEPGDAAINQLRMRRP